MSAPIRTDMDEGLATPTMFPPSIYAPPWARDAVTEAADSALAASERLRRALPPAPQLTEGKARSRRDPLFEGDVAIQRLRERPSLDPVTVPAPPLRERGSAMTVLARVVGAVGLAALAAFFMVSAMPLSLQGAVKAEGDASAPSLWSRLVGGPARDQQSASPLLAARAIPAEQISLADRFSAASVVEPSANSATLPAKAVQTILVQPEPVPPAEPAASIRTLDASEIAGLYRRGAELIAQGDIAAARLLLTRAAEAGDARSSLALGATYDAGVLRTLGVLGVAADAGQARAWYARASEFGSGEAAQRLEKLAQATR